MAIEIKKEPVEISKAFGSLTEQCYFCKASTRHWHEESNTPICQKCAEEKTDNDLIISKILQKVVNNKPLSEIEKVFIRLEAARLTPKQRKDAIDYLKITHNIKGEGNKLENLTIINP